MELASKARRWWPLVAVVWPLAIVTLAYAWPGHDDQAELRAQLSRRNLALPSPPAAVIAEQGELSGAGAAGGARIFWETPKPGQVRIQVEIPPEERQNSE